MMSKMSILTVCCLLFAVIAEAGIIDPCASTVAFNGSPPECYFACPDGDAESFAQAGFSLSFRIVDYGGNPIPFIPGADFWLIDCDPARNLALCAGSSSSNADSSTNVHGRTTMSATTLAVGGCANGLSPVVQGYVLGCPGHCFDVRVRSLDQNGDLQVTITDLAAFAMRYPPNPYNECADFNCDGRISLADLARFARHYGHRCN